MWLLARECEGAQCLLFVKTAPNTLPLFEQDFIISIIDVTEIRASNISSKES